MRATHRVRCNMYGNEFEVCESGHGTYTRTKLHQEWVCFAYTIEYFKRYERFHVEKLNTFKGNK